MLLVVSSCSGNGRRFDDDDDTSVRFGENITPEKLKEFDGLPDVSADGTKVVFTSGRDGVRRTYKFDSSDTADASRLTGDSDELTEEFKSLITSDGSWVLLLASKDNVVDLFLKDFSGSQTIQQVTDSDSLVETEFVMNDDSTAYAFIRRSSTGNGQLYVGLLDSNGLSGDPKLISSETSFESKPVFIPTGVTGSYAVASISREPGSLTSVLKKREVSSSLVVTATTELISDINYVDSVGLTAHNSGVIFSTLNATADTSVDPLTPVGDYETTARVTVNSFNQSVPSAGGSVTNLKSFGFDVVANSHTTDSSAMGLWIVKDAYSCKADLEYGSSLVVYNPSSEEDSYRLRLRVEEDQSTTVQTSVCNNKITVTDDAGEESEKELSWDKSILEAKVAADSTLSSFKAVYTSLLTGNTEVRILEYDGTSYSVVEVSKVSE